MGRYIIRRLASLIPILLIVTLVTFALSFFSASDPITAKYSSMGIVPDAELLEQEREEAGLNDPFIVQYLRWLGNVLTGSFGESYNYGTDAGEVLLKRLPNTLKLGLLTIFFSLLIALPMGVLAAIKKGTWVDMALRLYSFLGVSMPSFWVAMLLMYAFGVKLQWLPVVGSSTWRHIILPCATLVFWMSALYIRRLRASVLEELNKRYVRGALARGVAYRTVLWHHVLPNALMSIVNMLGQTVGLLLGGATVVEVIFEWQGIGKLAVASISLRDYTVILAYVVWVTLIYVLVNLACDLLCHALDPRLNAKEERE